MGKLASFEVNQAKLSLIASVPVFLCLIVVMLYAGTSVWLVLATGLIGSITVGYSAYRIHQSAVYQFRTLDNLLSAIIEGDFTLRARFNKQCGALDDLVRSINGLSHRLSQQRSESVESQLLLRVVIDHIVVAIIAITPDNKVRFSNPAAKRFNFPDTGKLPPEILRQILFVQNVSSGYSQVVELSLGSMQGKFHIHVEEYRESGIQNKLLFITDVGTLLRSEERNAWQRLVRVISHEINNSLSPIASISQTLKSLAVRDEKEDDLNGSLLEGLTIISERANGLKRFIESYKQLAKLPDPNEQKISIRWLTDKVRCLFKEYRIVIEDCADVKLYLDPVQIEQVLINLVKNASESMTFSNSGGAIYIDWRVTGSVFKLSILDEGIGIANPDNLFIPFYSTKKNGSGIGLVLCRQIVEAHGGCLTIVNRADAAGVCASIELPMISIN